VSQKVLTPSDVQKALATLISDLRIAQPNYTHHDRCYMTGLMLLRNFVGPEWMEKHVTGKTAPTVFFKNDWATEERRNTHKVRVIHLAEFLINLQFVPNFRELLIRLKGGSIEPTFAELEVGKLLLLNRVPFRFVKTTGKKGADYDLELNLNGIIVCADTKCKLETTSRGIDTVLASLKTARGQLPDDKPGMVFVKVPQSWNPDGTDDGHRKDMKEIANAFFVGRGAYKGTKHVVAVNFYFSLALEFPAGTIPVLLCQDFVNENHRHSKDVNWNILGHPNKNYGAWIDIIKMCA
jgi:hypothetical protein